jgi:Patatin-like phospholipase
MKRRRRPRSSSSWSRWARVLAALTLTGCGFSHSAPYSTLRSEVRHIQGVGAQPQSTAVQVGRQALLNATRLESYSRESSYYRSKTGLPKQCLALSGGGIRSAAFSIGVLKALHEKNYLSTIDVISSVSGGSYAAGWFHAQHIATEGNRDKVFDEASLIRLSEKARLVSLPPMSFLRGVRGVAIWLAHFFNGLAGLTYGGSADPYSWVDGSAAAFEYEGALTRTFFSSPEGTAVDPFVGDLAPRITKYGLPFLVINTTIGRHAESDAPAGAFSKRIFEFTPIRIGADSVGHFSVSPRDGAPEDPNSSLGTFSLSRVVRISGAALDARTAKSVGRRAVTELVELDLGAEVFLREESTPNDPPKKAFVYLSDGGFADNLGAYSAIRRLCGEIVIVDAEFDPTYGFDAYCKLKKALQTEMHVSFAVDEVDKALARSPQPRPGEQKNGSAPGCPPGSDFDGSRPVMRGLVESFPLAQPSSSGRITDHSLDIVYVKLSLDNKEFDDVVVRKTADRGKLESKYSANVVEWYAVRKQASGADVPDFPQLSTVHQNFTPTQFRAYVDLGYKTVLNNWALFEPSARLSGLKAR